MGMGPQKAGKSVHNMDITPVALVAAATGLASMGAGPVNGSIAALPW